MAGPGPVVEQPDEHARDGSGIALLVIAIRTGFPVEARLAVNEWEVCPADGREACSR
jgi:hypothetical protein